MSKDRLLFSCSWEKNREVSWSGTHNSLFKSLQKYFDICDLDTSCNDDSFESKVTKIKAKIGCMTFSKTYKEILGEKIIKKITDDKKIAECESVLQFDVFPSFEKKISIYIRICTGVI